MGLPSLDFETFSTAGYRFDKELGRFVPLLKSKPGIRGINAATYAMHPSTRILCLYYNLKDGYGVRGWFPWNEAPTPLLDHIAAGKLIEAHNSIFEWYIWYYLCFHGFGWPMLHLEQLRCSASKCRSYCLPGDLERASAYLTPDRQKDKRGKQLIQLLSIPQKPTKKQPLLFRDPYRFPELHAEMGEYCKQDVVAECAVSDALPELSGFELSVWKLDQRINTAGVQIDVEALNAFKDIWHQADTKYTEELRRLTNGGVMSIDEFSKGSGGDKWLQTQGINSPSLDKKHVDKLVASGIPDIPKRALEIKQLLGSSSAKKIFTIDRILNTDGRIRDLFQYCGAEKTGRFCIAENEKVLIKTEKGEIRWEKIQNIKDDWALWDGSEWVEHDGVIYAGKKEIVEYDGIKTTKDHRVFISATEYDTMENVKKRKLRIYRGEKECPITFTS